MRRDPLGRYEEALTSFEKAIKLDPTSSGGSWHGKGLALLRLGRYEEALVACEEALKTNPNDPRTWFDKGRALGYLGRRDEAIKWLCRAWRARDHLPRRGYIVGDFLHRELGYDPAKCEKRTMGKGHGY